MAIKFKEERPQVAPRLKAFWTKEIGLLLE